MFSKGNHLVNKKSLQVKRKNVCLNEKTPFIITEAYKSIRTNLLYTLSAKKTKVIVVSSAGPSEGKSTTCANLAITLSQTSSKILLIDADMRKPTQHKIFRLNNTAGLSTVICGFVSGNEVVKKDVRPNLDVLTAGPNPPNPAELLGSENMQVFLETMKHEYDLIIIDTPPINVVSDALTLLNDSSGVVIVCKQKQTTYDEIQKVIDNVRITGVNILGVIVNYVKHKEKINATHKDYKDYSYEYGKN